METIRHVKQNEWDSFMRFLEKAYGHAWEYFPSHYPDIYHTQPSCLEHFCVIEKKGKIVSHVGLYPLNVVSDEVKITLGGIGGVATLPEERGYGYMQRLLLYVITQMKEKDIPVSVLWGDRQRYGNFGWETAGERVVLQFSERSLDKSDIKPVSSIQEVDPNKAMSKVRQLYINQKFRVDRGKRLRGVLSRAGNRIWIGDDGYLCGRCINNKLVVNEVVSVSGKETSFIKAVMQWCFVKEAEMAICTHDRERFAWLIKPACGWSVVPEGMFRINNCYRFLTFFKPLLEKRATELKIGDFSLSIGLRFNDKVDVVTVKYKSGTMFVSQKKTVPYIEMDVREGVRFFLGGPLADRTRLGLFSTLLPLPIYIPELDRV